MTNLAETPFAAAARKSAKAIRGEGQLPQNAEIVDTLGWVYVQREMLALTITTLQEAVRLAPANALYAYHLGVAYAKNGEDAKARKSLEAALKLRPDFERAPDATSILANSFIDTMWVGSGLPDLHVTRPQLAG